MLSAKKNLRLLALPEDFERDETELRQVSGGLLVQSTDAHFAPALQWRLVAGEAADADTLADLEFAWRACRSVKSNAILLATDGASVGIGMGQVNRVDSCKLAVERAGDRALGSVAASDAFFPFDDGARILLDAGVTRDRAARRLDPRRGRHRGRERVRRRRCTSPGERHFFH